jgi:hypothetical protein
MRWECGSRLLIAAAAKAVSRTADLTEQSPRSTEPLTAPPLHTQDSRLTMGLLAAEGSSMAPLTSSLAAAAARGASTRRLTLLGGAGVLGCVWR